MEEFLQLKQEVHEIAEKLKEPFEENADNGEKEEKGNPSSEKKGKVEGNKKKGKGTSHSLWKKAPMVQINVTCLEIGNQKRFSIIVDTSPFEFHESFFDPLQFFKIKDGTLVKTTDYRLEMAQHKVRGRAHASWDPRPAKITSASTHAWARKGWPRATPNCDCDPAYSEEGRDHSQASMCKAWAIGAAIANKLWNDEPIEGMTFEKRLLA